MNNSLLWAAGAAVVIVLVLAVVLLRRRKAPQAEQRPVPAERARGINARPAAAPAPAVPNGAPNAAPVGSAEAQRQAAAAEAAVKEMTSALKKLHQGYLVMAQGMAPGEPVGKKVVVKKPAGAPVTERAVPVTIFGTEDKIRRHYLRKWCRDSGMKDEDMDIRALLDCLLGDNTLAHSARLLSHLASVGQDQRTVSCFSSRGSLGHHR